VRLDWTDNAVNEDSYRVERRELSSGFSEIALLGANSQSYVDSGLSPLTTYVYRVRASNSAGDSAYSNEVTVTTPSPAAPEAPTGLAVDSVGATRVVLRWNDNSSREDGFRVERSREGGPYVSVASLPPNTVRFEDKGLDDLTSYSYRVVAFNLGGSSAPSNVVTVTTKLATMCRIDTLVYTVDPGSGQEDIFVRSTDGRFSKRITNTVASEQEVAVSPRGDEIWFSSTEAGRRKLFSVDVDGTSRRIRSNQPSGNFDDWGPALWAAPDGSRKLVVFVSNRGGSEEIYSMRPDATGLARLTNIGSGSRRSPVISSDGSTVYFASSHSGTFRIYKVSAAGGTPAEVASSAPGNQFDPAISPDGKRLAYVTDRFGGGARLVERDLLSGTERALMATSVPYAERPRWSPDGKFLYVTVLGPSGNFDIKKIEVASGSMTGALTTSAAERVGDAAPLAPYEASPSPTFFAEGATTGGFATWLLLANPSTDSASPANPARACVTLLTEEGKKRLGVVDIPAGYRISIDVGSYWRSFSVGAVVEAIRGSVGAERAVYSSAPSKVGAHLSKGSKRLSRAWYTAEGATAGEFETWILVSNPGTIAANVDISLVTASGPTSPYRVSVPAGARVSVRADDLLPDSFDVAASVTSDRPVVVERATYTSGPSRRGATASPAFPSGRTTWYVGEGATTGGFETWLLIANPNDQPACAEVTLLVGGPDPGPLTIYGGSRPPLCMGAKQRRTLNLGSYVSSYDVASKVVSVAGSDGTYVATQPRGIVVERAVYHDHPSLGKGAASGEGSPRAALAWLGVEGATAGGFETWTLIANPGSQPACASITYLTDAGPIPDPRANPVCLRPGARVSIRADDIVWSYHVSALVRAVPGSAGGISAPVARPIVVEHSVYTPPELSGDSTSGPALIVASP
jgi:Tol biopolymer transport system component